MMILLGLPSRMFGFCALCTLTRSRVTRQVCHGAYGGLWSGPPRGG